MLKIVLNHGQKIFLTSDSHYNHKNICRGVSEWNNDDITRDFKTLSEMNDAIVNGINETVGQDDILIHLGDWSFGGFDSIREFRNRIFCRNIHLITGNHDHHIENDREGIRSIFNSVHDNIAKLEVRYPSANPIGKIDIINAILCHFPICSWENMNKGWIHLFGHVHLPPFKCVMPGRAMDVGMDGNNYKPYNLFHCISNLKDRQIQPTVLPSDHHAQ